MEDYVDIWNEIFTFTTDARSFEYINYDGHAAFDECWDISENMIEGELSYMPNIWGLPFYYDQWQSTIERCTGFAKF